jgi:dipeptidyl aminopeptidase/acylaminoacyl peptidase
MTRFAIALAMAVSLPGAALPTAPGIDAALGFAVPTNPQISPDGAQVVYQLSRTNWEANAFESDLWLVDLSSPRRARRLNAGPGWNGDPQWSPDGRSIAFASDRGSKRQVFVIAAGGGESSRLTSVENGVNEFRWAPDSKSLAFTTDADRDPHPGRRDRYGDFEVVRSEATASSLWRVWPDSRLKELIGNKRYSVGGFAWSPDGSRIAFQSEGIYVLDVAGGAVSAVASGAGPCRNPVWSPDGRRLAFETAGGDPGFYYSNWFIATAPAEGGQARPVTKSFDENANLYAWTPVGIFFGALARTASHLFVADPVTGAIRRVTTPEDSAILPFSLTPDGARFTYIRGGAHGLAEVYVSGENTRPVRLTEHSAQTAPYIFARREVVRWNSADGTEIEGILYKPADFDPARKYPLLVAIHGGPATLDQPFVFPDRTYPVEQFVAKGALVLRPNYRGSTGYGARFRALPVGNLGSGDAADIIAGVDSLVEKGLVDPDRVGAMGWSEGGYIAAFVATSTDRFRAVSVGAGISDWLTYYVNTDITPFTRQYLRGTPWEEPEVYRKASPITYIDRAKTPVLIQHGDRDRRVPIPNAYELRQALEDHNVPVRMIVYKGFGHTIDRPKQQRAVMEHNLEWFSQWILDPKAPAAPVTVSDASGARSTGDSP